MTDAPRGAHQQPSEEAITAAHRACNPVDGHLYLFRDRIALALEAAYAIDGLGDAPPPPTPALGCRRCALGLPQTLVDGIHWHTAGHSCPDGEPGGIAPPWSVLPPPAQSPAPETAGEAEDSMDDEGLCAALVEYAKAFTLPVYYSDRQSRVSQAWAEAHRRIEEYATARLRVSRPPAQPTAGETEERNAFLDAMEGLERTARAREAWAQTGRSGSDNDVRTARDMFAARETLLALWRPPAQEPPPPEKDSARLYRAPLRSDTELLDWLIVEACRPEGVHFYTAGGDYCLAHGDPHFARGDTEPTAREAINSCIEAEAYFNDLEHRPPEARGVPSGPTGDNA